MIEVLAYKLTNQRLLGVSVFACFKEAVKMWGKPYSFHTDNGGEFTNIQLDNEMTKNNIINSFSQGYKPFQNGRQERVYRSLKQENNYFKDFERYDYSGKENAVQKWIQHYNYERWHSGIKGVPMEFRNAKKNKLSLV